MKFNDRFIERFQHTNGLQSIIFANWATNLHEGKKYCTVHYVRQFRSDNISSMDDDSLRSSKNLSKQHKMCRCVYVFQFSISIAFNRSAKNCTFCIVIMYSNQIESVHRTFAYSLYLSYYCLYSLSVVSFLFSYSMRMRTCYRSLPPSATVSSSLQHTLFDSIIKTPKSRQIVVFHSYLV